jgi:hypothetical protein
VTPYFRVLYLRILFSFCVAACISCCSTIHRDQPSRVRDEDAATTVGSAFSVLYEKYSDARNVSLERSEYEPNLSTAIFGFQSQLNTAMRYLNRSSRDLKLSLRKAAFNVLRNAKNEQSFENWIAKVAMQEAENDTASLAVMLAIIE